MQTTIEENSKMSDAKFRACLERGKRAQWWKRDGTKEKGFAYFYAQDKRIRDKESLERIKKSALLD